jgi:CHAT domain-containing protein
MSSKDSGKGSVVVDDWVEELERTFRQMAGERSLAFSRGAGVRLQDQLREILLGFEATGPIRRPSVERAILASFARLLDAVAQAQHRRPMRDSGADEHLAGALGDWSLSLVRALREEANGGRPGAHTRSNEPPRMESTERKRSARPFKEAPREGEPKSDDDGGFAASVESDAKAAEPWPSAPSPPVPPAPDVLSSPAPSSGPWQPTLIEPRAPAAPPRNRHIPFASALPDGPDRAAAAPEPDPPRSAYARLDAPEVAVSGVEIEVVVGLAEKATPGVVGGAMTRPAGSVGAYTLSIHLVADGFQVRDGETLRRDLRVTAAEPYPTTTFHLIPAAQAEEVRPRALQAFFEVEGQTMGVAFRPLAVVRSRDLAATAERPETPPGVDLAIPTEPGAADLEVRILLVADHPGRLLWTFNTPHKGIDLPDAAVATEIGSEPQSFTRTLVDKVNAREGKRGIYALLAGLGATIADQIPAEMAELLRAVAARAAGVPNVLLLSQEPYVPWELARLDAPLLDPAAPPFLAAQVNVGRWVLPAQVERAGRGPRQPPPIEIAVRSSAVVSGVYDLPGWSRLNEAEAEAGDLVARLGAARVAASSEEVLGCLNGVPAADLLHFAVHGIYDPLGVEDGLMLTDGVTLDPYEVRGSTLKAAPFVFLNACQVGAGNKILGDYAGMAAAFLNAGASGVVAPLWSVKDTIAREIAEAFYAPAAGETTPAAALRAARKGFRDTTEAQSATYLAYQFFGHPALKLRFLQSRGDPPHGDPAQP